MTAGDMHANLGSRSDMADTWDLHVWTSINNTSGSPFAGTIRINTIQDSTGITASYSNSIVIASGKSKYPVGHDTWLVPWVGTGSGKPKDVYVTITIKDEHNNTVSVASKYAN